MLICYQSNETIICYLGNKLLALRNIPEHRKAWLIFTFHKIDPTVPINANESAAMKALSETHLGSITGEVLAPAFPRTREVLHVVLTTIQKYEYRF